MGFVNFRDLRRTKERPFVLSKYVLRLLLTIVLGISSIGVNRVRVVGGVCVCGLLLGCTLFKIKYEHISNSNISYEID